MVTMTSQQIRQQFLDFFESKGHKIVASAPMVTKNDPTLLFTNAGMNQFKDLFLGNKTIDAPRVADTQKCLRVSGKHNDLEEVGIDSYHHTMFEMLGNWSFGNYFKKESIEWAWELLTVVYKLDANRLYATVFEGDKEDNIEKDQEAYDIWKKILPEERIIWSTKKDNFWEMGETGPSGPSSEIHIDLRSDSDRKEFDGRLLVNHDHPLVIEIWNLVFIQYNRKVDRSLEKLSANHVDTGMGFERLCMAIQGKQSNYETDIFSPLISYIEKYCNIKYTNQYNEVDKSDIAMRVIADHIRAVSFAIADGQLPENTGAGYVIRRILRRAVRYYYSFLDIKEPFMHTMVAILADQFAPIFPELKAQQTTIKKVIEAEEKSFLNTLETGLKRFDNLDITNGVISGQDAFELFDTYGFPIDLTRLLASENKIKVDEKAYQNALQNQKNRSKKDANKSFGDWIEVLEGIESRFVGYDEMRVEDAKIIKYRTVQFKGKDQFQLVLDRTPFYPESGGQRGDTGLLDNGLEKIKVLDAQKENDLGILVVDKLPKHPSLQFEAKINVLKRENTSKNHSAVHLLHSALHRILGETALQKGQDVNDKRLRFDFSYFEKLSPSHIMEIEAMVNNKVLENIALLEERNVPINKAREKGALMLFGEKYGNQVRVITFDKDYSVELCGGTHVQATGKIGLFKVVSESGIAAGVRRIEAVTGINAIQYTNQLIEDYQDSKSLLKNPKNLKSSIENMLEENRKIKKTLEKMVRQQAAILKQELLKQVIKKDTYHLIASHVNINESNALKSLAHQLDKEVENGIIVLGAAINNKPQILVLINRELQKNDSSLNANSIIKHLAPLIKGGGGGQPFLATAGGKDLQGLDKAIDSAKELLG